MAGWSTALMRGQIRTGWRRRRLYLPTRRAGRMAREIFLDVLGTGAVLPPRIVALGDIDENELEFAQAAAGTDLASLDTPPALDGVLRRLLLAQLIAAWADKLKPGDPAQAPLVIGGTGRDSGTGRRSGATDGRQWQRAASTGRRWDGLVPDALDQYWQLTLAVPEYREGCLAGILKAYGRIEPAAGATN